MSHIPVLAREVIRFFCQKNLNDRQEIPFFADLTFGEGGHSFEILRSIPYAKIWAFDQDPHAIKEGKEKIYANNFEERIKLVKGNFAYFNQYLEELDVAKKTIFDGILLDLGLSSQQVDIPARGFSFRHEAPLDMRMDNSDQDRKTAFTIVNTYGQKELERIILEYGEEMFARKIAKRIVENRAKKTIETTKELAYIVGGVYPKALRYGRIHPATRTFQALRIEVNDEIDALHHSLSYLPQMLKIGGRLQIISFHSLEDRIVKQKFKALKQNKAFFLNSKRPIRPSEEEISHNFRSRSAKLRVIERIS